MKNYLRENDQLVSVYFEDMNELIDHEETGTNSETFAKYKNDKRGTTWFGPSCDSSKEVLRCALLGDDLLLASLEPKIVQLEKASGDLSSSVQLVKKAKRVRTRGAFGDELDIHRVLSGDLDTAWSKTTRVVSDSHHSLVTLVIDIGASAMTDVRDTLWRAAVAVKIYRQLIKAGKSVKIIVAAYGVNTFTNSRKSLTHAAVVKQYDQPLTDSRLAAMAHCGFNRAFGFQAMCCSPYRLTYSLGYPTSAKPTNLPIQLQEEIEKGHTLPILLGQAENLDRALGNLQSAYNQMEAGPIVS